MPFVHMVLGYDVFDSVEATPELVGGDDLTNQFHWMEGLLVGHCRPWAWRRCRAGIRRLPAVRLLRLTAQSFADDQPDWPADVVCIDMNARCTVQIATLSTMN